MGNHSTTGPLEHHTPVYDLKAFEDLYRRMYPTLIKYAVYMVRDPEEAQLLLNDVFISIWKNQLQITQEKAYLFRSVKNAALTYLKNSRIHFDVLEEEQIPLIPDQNADPSQAYQEKDRNRALYKLIDQLPERRRLVFYLYRIDGFSYKEIAALLDISVRTVEDHLVKGFQFLQEKVIRHEEEFR